MFWEPALSKTYKLTARKESAGKKSVQIPIHLVFQPPFGSIFGRFPREGAVLWWLWLGSIGWTSAHGWCYATNAVSSDVNLSSTSYVVDATQHMGWGRRLRNIDVILSLLSWSMVCHSLSWYFNHYSRQGIYPSWLLRTRRTPQVMCWRRLLMPWFVCSDLHACLRWPYAQKFNLDTQNAGLEKVRFFKSQGNNIQDVEGHLHCWWPEDYLLWTGLKKFKGRKKKAHVCSLRGTIGEKVDHNNSQTFWIRKEGHSQLHPMWQRSLHSQISSAEKLGAQRRSLKRCACRAAQNMGLLHFHFNPFPQMSPNARPLARCVTMSLCLSFQSFQHQRMLLPPTRKN